MFKWTAERQGNENKEEKQRERTKKTENKKADLGSTISIIALDVNGIIYKLKGRLAEWLKIWPNYMLSTRTTLQMYLLHIEADWKQKDGKDIS